MGRTIDERIVQMTFNNQEFERRANTTISTLDKLKKNLDFSQITKNFGDLDRAANKIDLSNLTGSLDGVRAGFSALETVAVGAMLRLGNVITDKVLGAVNALWAKLTSMSDLQMLGQGFQKYNDLTASVQTLVNSTGKSMDDINGYLDKLMWYSDETSFGFTDMTKALGTMVSSGGNIDKLIPLLMGVGNAVAYAGKGASEFSRVIYNLNQSYSSGFLNTMDWRSIELAGADSKVLKEQLLAAAVELKTVNKESAKLENFRDLLSDKVFTREVMEKAFGNFAAMSVEAEKLVSSGAFKTASEAIEHLSGNFEEFQERAFKSAQEAKSFREAIEATQDAVSSGWMQTFKIIFGDYNESKALWTDVTETFWELFASSANGRNTILAEWKKIWEQMIENPEDAGLDYSQWKEISPWLTQTQALVASISDVILAIRDDVVDIWRFAFPVHTMLDEHGNIVEDYSKTARTIFNTVEGIRNLFIDIKEQGLKSDLAVGLRASFRALLEILKTIIAYVKVFVESFIKPLNDRLKPLINEIGNLFKNVANIINRTAQGARQDFTPFEKVLSNLLDILQPLIDLLKDALHWVNALLSGVKDISIFDGIFSGIGNVIQFISKVVTGSVPLFQTLGKTLSNLLSKVSDSIVAFLSGHGSNMGNVATGIASGGLIGYLTYGLYGAIKALKDFDLAGFAKKFTLEGLAEGIKGVFGALNEGIAGLFGGGGAAANTNALKDLGDAIIKLAAALLILSFVDADKIVGGLAGLAVALGEVLGVIAILNGMTFMDKSEAKGFKGFFESINTGIRNLTGGNNFSQGIKAIKSVAMAILELSVALKIMSTIDPLGMTTALVGLGVALGELSVFLLILSNTSKDLKRGDTKALAKMLSKLGFAMIEIAAAMKIMSTIDGPGLSKAMIGMGIALAEIAAFVIAVSKFTSEASAAKIAALGPSLMAMGFGIIELAAAMKILSTIDASGTNTALVALFGMLGSVALFAIAISKLAGAGNFAVISAGLVILSVGIAALSVAVLALGKVSWNTVANGIKALLAVFGSVALVGSVLGILSPLLLAASIAFTAFAASLYLISAAMLKAVTAFGAFSLISGSLMDGIFSVMTDAFAAIIALIPSFIIGIVEAVISVAGELIKLVGTLINVVLTAVNEQLPTVLSNIITFLKTVLEGLINAVTTLGPLIFDLVLALFNVLIEKLKEAIPDILGKLFELLITLINSLADIIRNDAGELGSALGNLAGALIEGLFGAIGGLIGGTAGGIIGAGKGLFEGITGIWKKVFGGGDQKEDQEEAGKDIIKNVKTGMEEKKEEVVEKANEIGLNVTEKLDKKEEATGSGRSTLSGLLVGLQDGGLLASIEAAGVAAGNRFMAGYNSTVKINSPSKEMEKSARYTIMGLLEGFKDLSDVALAGNQTGEAIVNAIRTSLDEANSILDDSLNPVITPVLDLSNVEANSAYIPGLLGTDFAYSVALAINAQRNGLLNQNGLQNSKNEITLNNTFLFNNASDLSDAELKRIAAKLADDINTILGNEI